MNRTASFTPSTAYVQLDNDEEPVKDLKLPPSLHLSSPSSEPSSCVHPDQVRVYRRRWLALAVFCLHLMVDNLYWIAFSPISVIASCYYGVGIFWINSLSWVYFVTLVIFFVPTMWFLKRFGLRVTAVIGGCALTAGGWLRFAGTDPDYFWLLLLGQAIVSITNFIEWSASTFLSSIWFPPSERAFATTLIGAVFPQIGILIGLFVGPFIIQSPNTNDICLGNVSRTSQAFLDWQEGIYQQLLYYQLVQALLSTILMPLTFLMPEAPPTPPSTSRTLETVASDQKPFWRELVNLFRNWKFSIFLFIFGIAVAISGTFLTVFDEVLVQGGYEDYQNEMGYVGFGVQCTAILGLLFTGWWLDRTKSFYLTSVAICILSTVGLAAFSIAVQLKLHFYLISVICSIAGGILAAYQGVGYEFGVEMSYPVPEAISAGFLNAAAQVVGIILVVIIGVFVSHNFAVYCGWLLAATFFVAAVLAVFIKPDLRRVKLDIEDSEKCCTCCHITFYRSRQKLS